MRDSNRFYIVAKRIDNNKTEYDDSETTSTLKDAKETINNSLKESEVGDIYTCDYEDNNSYYYNSTMQRTYKNVAGKITLIERKKL